MHHKECLCFPMIFFYYYYLFIYTLLACFLPFLFSFLFSSPPLFQQAFQCLIPPSPPLETAFQSCRIFRQEAKGWLAGGRRGDHQHARHTPQRSEHRKCHSQRAGSGRSSSIIQIFRFSKG